MQQIGLGKDDVDRNAGVKIFIQFRKPPANGAQFLPLLLGVAGQKIGDRQCHQRAIDRLRAAITSQKAEESFPASLR
ncbi:hypothetical protein D3C87_1703300 [compost metagenome]